MAAQSFADRMARKTEEDPKFQRSWRVHLGAFGPVLENAFRDDCQAMVHLCAALNHISRRECDQGIQKLRHLEDRCVSRTDQAALAFFYGLCWQMAGDERRMKQYYLQSTELELPFYIPYMKLAKHYQTACMYDKAAKYYRGAIACYDGMGLGDGEKVILGSAYAGLATCLTMMHRYTEAERTLESSRTICPDGPGRSAVEAILYAALGRRTDAEAALRVLLTHAPQAYEETRRGVQDILDGESLIFSAPEPDQEMLTRFWSWFLDYEDSIDEDALSSKYNELFPQAEGELRVRIRGNRITFPDHYFAALTRLCRELLACCPSQIAGRWNMEIVPYLE